MKWKDIDIGYKSQFELLKRQGPYERLGLQPGAGIDEVKQAYRKKMRLYHPDKTSSFMSEYGEEVTKLLNQAIEQIKREIGR